jgi:hypothetical protein
MLRRSAEWIRVALLALGVLVVPPPDVEAQPAPAARPAASAKPKPKPRKYSGTWEINDTRRNETVVGRGQVTFSISPEGSSFFCKCSGTLRYRSVTGPESSVGQGPVHTEPGACGGMYYPKTGKITGSITMSRSLRITYTSPTQTNEKTENDATTGTLTGNFSETAGSGTVVNPDGRRSTFSVARVLSADEKKNLAAEQQLAIGRAQAEHVLTQRLGTPEQQQEAWEKFGDFVAGKADHRVGTALDVADAAKTAMELKRRYDAINQSVARGKLTERDARLVRGLLVITGGLAFAADRFGVGAGGDDVAREAGEAGLKLGVLLAEHRADPEMGENDGK